MPATLDPATALVLIDLQHGITALPTAHPSEQIVARCARLADAFRANGKLVAATRVTFARDGGDVIKTRTAESPADVKPVPDYGELRAEIGLSDGDMLITKHGWSAFYGTELDLELRRRKVTGIVLAGISTSIGVESTARAANERGYELTIVTDAITDTDEGAHLNSLRAIFPQIAELATTEEVLTALRASIARTSPKMRLLDPNRQHHLNGGDDGDGREIARDRRPGGCGTRRGRRRLGAASRDARMCVVVGVDVDDLGAAGGSGNRAHSAAADAEQPATAASACSVALPSHARTGRGHARR